MAQRQICWAHLKRDFQKCVDRGGAAAKVGAAGLRIERVSYLPSGRVVEFTRSLYRGDAYDFAAELQIPEQEGRT